MRRSNARAENLALNLLDLGIKPLDRLVVQLPNRIQFVYLYLALQKIGAIAGDGAARASLSRNQPVRGNRGRHRLRHAGQASRFRFSRAGPPHPERTAAIEARHRAGRSAGRFRIAGRADRTQIGARSGRACAHQNRSLRSRAVSSVGRHHRRAEADPAHA